MDLATGIWVGITLFVLLLVPYLGWEIRRGKKHGHTWFNWFKPRGHSDVGPEEANTLMDNPAVRYTKPGIDEARGARR